MSVQSAGYWDHAAEQRELRERRYRAALANTWAGLSAFWDLGPGGYDNEQYVPLFGALKSALQLNDVTDAQRWQHVMRVLKITADEYAHLVAIGEAE